MRLSNEEFDQIYRKVVRLCLDLVIVKDGKVLMTKRAIEPYMGWWHLPGGTMLFGESIEEGIDRVAKSELRIKVELVKLLGPLEYPSEVGESGGTRHSVSLVYLCDYLEGEIVLDRQANDFDWFGVENAQMVPEHRELLVRYWCGQGV